MTRRSVPTRDEVLSYLRDRRNWGRWGDKGAAGAMNLIDDAKRLAATRLVQKGRTVSLSRPFPVQASPGNPRPAHHYVTRGVREPDGGSAGDYYGVAFHGWATTHIDALSHVWDSEGMWDGKDPDEVIHVQRLDLRIGRQLERRHPDARRAAGRTEAQGQSLRDAGGACARLGAGGRGRRAGSGDRAPGDAVMVYSGREAYTREMGHWGPAPRPGLHASCLPFVRDNDISILGWDMMDIVPNEYDVPWTVHGAIFAYGVALLDNALLEPLAAVCAEEGRYEFMVTINPLYVVGGTGSPVNPIAVF